MIWNYADCLSLITMGFLEPENSKFFSARFKNFLCQINLSELAFLGEVAFLAFGVGGIGLVGLWGPLLTLHLSKVILLTR